MIEKRSELASSIKYLIFSLILLGFTLALGYVYVRDMKRINGEYEKMFNENFYAIGIETRLNLYPKGLVVSEVYSGTPAKRADIRKYDVILRINSGDAKFDRLEYISRSAATVKLEIRRGNRVLKISVVPELMQRKLIITPVKIICTNCETPYEVNNYNSK